MKKKDTVVHSFGPGALLDVVGIVEEYQKKQEAFSRRIADMTPEDRDEFSNQIIALIKRYMKPPPGQYIMELGVNITDDQL